MKDAADERKIIMAIGLPGSGKTSYLWRYAGEIGAAYICPDDIREELLGDASDMTQEDQVWKEVHARISKALSREDVVIDGTGIEIEHRRRNVVLYHSMGAKVIAYYFPTALEVCLERNQKRSRQVPPARIRELHELLAANPPSAVDGFDQVFQIDAARTAG